MENKESRRKVLISPSYGAGWVSWYYGNLEQKGFMLEYAPFIEYIDNGGIGADIPQDLIDTFLSEWAEKFPGVDTPYVGGLDGLMVIEVTDGVRVVVTEYDGFESLEYEDDDREWL